MSDGGTLVTGGAGYVGSHVALALLDSGRRVVVADNLSTGDRAWVPEAADFIEAELADPEQADRLLAEAGCDAIVHLAGAAALPASPGAALEYERNNTDASRNLLEAAAARKVRRFVFASTAAVYGNPKTLPVNEHAATSPRSLYGKSKLKVERMLRDLSSTSRFRFVVLRYFNVAGADLAGRSGPLDSASPSLVKAACEAACGTRESVSVFGDDYDTSDGTGIRDYIHVGDLALAHVRALDYLADGGQSEVLDCACGRGRSVRQVLEAMRQVSGRDFRVEAAPRRPGDVATIYAEAKRIRAVLGWSANPDLTRILASAYAWESRMPQSPRHAAIGKPAPADAG